MDRTYRVALVASHVIQYQDPFFRLLASAPDVEGVTGVYFKRFKPAATADPSNDTTLQARLWDVSARLVGLPSNSGTTRPVT